ncbi:hypothetical protein IGX29_03450 [Streptomyces sp. H28]|uniref:hypothetical protein n=1 Tax=Streptomyces sp. H28 TaxID=2775865 RepID=UPI00177D6FD1|nr:hypothetical protein [Streptomyces sp. H28]MBD9730887.1 hypothetical protein [Streptomyces sp. H28]
MSGASTWGLVVETTVGTGQRKHTEAQVVAHVTGSRAEALEELERRARTYRPWHPTSPKRRRLLRMDDGFLLVVDGAYQSFGTRFTVAELLADSDAPAAAGPGPEGVPGTASAPQDPPAPAEPDEPSPGGPDTVSSPDAVSGPAAVGELDEDGVPVRPSWLGRPHL